MTSEFTLGPTAQFFEEHGYFGLDPGNVVMFEQRMLPAVAFDGRAILERKDKVAMAPGAPARPPARPAAGRELGPREGPPEAVQVWGAGPPCPASLPLVTGLTVGLPGQ